MDGKSLLPAFVDHNNCPFTENILAFRPEDNKVSALSETRLFSYSSHSMKLLFSSCRCCSGR